MRPIILALLPNSQCHERLVFLSQLIHPHCGDEGILLNPEKGPIPHGTLIQAHVQEALHADAWRRALARYEDGPTPSLEFTEVQAHGPYIFAMIRETRELLDLHYDEACMIGNLRYRNMENPDELTPEQAQSVEAFGWAYGLLAYRPHVTIGRCKDTMTAKRIVANLKEDGNLRGLVCEKPRLALGAMGPHGTLVDILKESPNYAPRIVAFAS